MSKEMPKAFISYSWDDEEHKKWVKNLATNLRQYGVETRLDQWHAIPGDQLPAFMEREIRDNDYVLIICTSNYKLKADGRKGGVGYEGDIIAGEIFTKGNSKKFIPILARGSWIDSAPSSLAGKFYTDLSDGKKYESGFRDLVATILEMREDIPPVSAKPKSIQDIKPVVVHAEDEDIKIQGIIVDEVTTPTMDGTRRSALYRVPFRLSKRPSSLWAELFVYSWNHPPEFTGMHRPGIASVMGNKIVLDGTTIEEVRDYHRRTLMLCVEEANKNEKQETQRLNILKKKEEERVRQHSEIVSSEAKKIKF